MTMAENTTGGLRLEILLDPSEVKLLQSVAGWCGGAQLWDVAYAAMLLGLERAKTRELAMDLLQETLTELDERREEKRRRAIADTT